MMKTNHLMGMFAVFFLLCISLLPADSFGEILTIKQTVNQAFGGGQSADDARISGIAKAKREALEKAGTYIESLTIVKNSMVEKDEILALTAGVLKTEVISQKNYHTKDGLGIELVVNVVVDTSVLEERVKKLLQDRTHLTQLKETQKREKDILLIVAKLEEENRNLMTKMQSTEKIKKQFQRASQGLTALDWAAKAYALRDGTNPKKAIEYLNNAIKLHPDFAEAYYNRGIAYEDLGQHQRAIEDYNKAIRFKTDFAEAYCNRGVAYEDLGQHQRAIEDYNEAIRLKLDGGEAYNNRGIVYKKLGQYQRAIEDYNKAIRLKLDDAKAYYNRGNAYRDLGQQNSAIKDYNEAIRLKPDLATAYVARGNVYRDIGQYQRAIEDYNKAIRLQSDLTEAYINRGKAYEGIGQYQSAIEDYSKSIRLQPDDAIPYYNRGTAYGKYFDQPQRAIEDFNEAIRLQPNYAAFRNNRGNAYFIQGNNKLGCRDAQKACALGNCELLERSKGMGYCR